MKPFVRAEQNPYGCGDTSCIFRIPSRYRGMSTNGGCRCLGPTSAPLHPTERTKLRQAIKWMAQEISHCDHVINDM